MPFTEICQQASFKSGKSVSNSVFSPLNVLLRSSAIPCAVEVTNYRKLCCLLCWEEFEKRTWRLRPTLRMTKEATPRWHKWTNSIGDWIFCWRWPEIEWRVFAGQEVSIALASPPQKQMGFFSTGYLITAVNKMSGRRLWYSDILISYRWFN